MRMVVIGLVLLSGLKVWTQDRMYRSAMGEALVEAYRERAAEVCRKLSPKRSSAAAAAEAVLGKANTWEEGADAQILLGNPDIEVAIWDTENPLWSQRFRHPQLVLTGTGGSPSHCAYDLRDGTATLSLK